MAKLTRSNVAYDLTISPHKEKIKYQDGNIVTYVFSSDFYRKKFLEKMGVERSKTYIQISKRLNMNFEIPIIADLRTYTSIEKRGFLIQINGDYVECLDNITLNGVILTLKS